MIQQSQNSSRIASRSSSSLYADFHSIDCDSEVREISWYYLQNLLNTDLHKPSERNIGGSGLRNRGLRSGSRDWKFLVQIIWNETSNSGSVTSDQRYYGGGNRERRAK